jgi:sec-independent protein translocase protein TatB
MFDLGMSELLVIGIVALIVVGPRDLPGMFRTLGRFTGKARNMAREFQRAMDQAADEAGVKDVKDVATDLRKMTSPSNMGLDKVREAADAFEKWDPLKGGAKTAPPPKSSAPVADLAATGPHTKALAEAQAAKRAAAAEARAARAAQNAATPSLAEGESVAKSAAKPAPKPRTARKTAGKSDA